jgi:hypothetical protein
MSIEQDIRAEIENIKKMKMEVGNINNHLSALEGMCRGDKRKWIDDAYNRGLENAWDVARKLAVETDDGGVSISDLYKIFGTESMCTIMKNNTVYDAIDKLKAYEDKQKDDGHIKVGDEVQAPCGIATVTSVEDDFVHYLYSDGDVGCIGPHSLKKTGKHYDIQSILEAMRE